MKAINFVFVILWSFLFTKFLFAQSISSLGLSNSDQLHANGLGSIDRTSYSGHKRPTSELAARNIPGVNIASKPSQVSAYSAVLSKYEVGESSEISEVCFISRQSASYRECGLIATKFDNGAFLAQIIVPWLSSSISFQWDKSYNSMFNASFGSATHVDYDELVQRYARNSVEFDIEEAIEDVEDAQDALRDANFDQAVGYGVCFVSAAGCGLHVGAGTLTGGLSLLGASYLCGGSLISCVVTRELGYRVDRARKNLIEANKDLNAAKAAKKKKDEEEAKKGANSGGSEGTSNMHIGNTPTTGIRNVIIREGTTTIIDIPNEGGSCQSSGGLILVCRKPL